MKSRVLLSSSSKIATEILSLNTDSIVIAYDEGASAYFEKILKELEKNNKDKNIVLISIPGGEKIKELDYYHSTIEELLKFPIHRKTHLIVVGGGATSDLMGFIAATVLRGIKWSVVPTTLLSMVDASVGGKVALNSRYGKNLIGAFHFPMNVWIDTESLKTLSAKEMKSGKGEILKYAFLDKKVYELILKNASQDKIIKACLDFKKKLCAKDPFEGKERKYLNLGHTYGHAFEIVYKVEHGIAVTMGIETILERFSPHLLPKFFELCKKLDLKLEKTVVNKKVKELLLKDKKRKNNSTIDLVILSEIGKPSLKNIPINDLID
jgi:3-dehydroquinate synthase